MHIYRGSVTEFLVVTGISELGLIILHQIWLTREFLSNNLISSVFSVVYYVTVVTLNNLLHQGAR